MPRIAAWSLVAALALLGPACTTQKVLPSAGDGGVAAPGLTYHQDVRPLLNDACVRCHQQGGIGPFPLDTYAEVSKRAAAIRVAVENRTMPPWQAGPGCSDYVDDFSLTDQEVKLLTDWVDEGAQEGTPLSGVAVDPPVPRGLPRVDRVMTMPVAYTPTKSPDDYRCFVLDWPETTDKFVTGFRAVPGDARVVHHVIAFLATPNRAAQYTALDDKEAGPGYTCYGGPGGSGVPGWLGAWAPGAEGGEFVPDTGIKIAPGSKIILQLHYNTSSQAPVADKTSIELMMADSVQKEAVIIPWANPQWLNSQTMTIPAGMSDVKHEFAIDPTPFMGNMTNNVIPKDTPFTVHSASLHMHTRGTRSRTVIQRFDSTTPECLLDIPRWDFHWQATFGFTAPKTLRPGDRLSFECHWDNSAGTTALNWGEGTNDEMCLGVYYVTR
jgi:hypothetical protein